MIYIMYLFSHLAEVISKQIGEELIFGTPVDEALVQKECTGGKSTTPSVPSLESALPEVASEEKDIVDAIINPLEKLKQISAVTDREQPAAEVIAEKDLTVSQVLELQHANVDSHLETSSLSASMKVTTEAPLSSLPREEFSQQTIVSAPSCEILSCPSKVLKDPSPPQLASAPTNILDIISKSPVTTERVESCAEVSNVVAPIDAETHQKTVLTQATSINVMTKQSEKPSTEGATVAPSISDLPETSKPIAETASEISTVSPVPIQVAESVLQAEPKESLLDDSKPLVTSVISSTVTPIHEATALPSEGLTRQDDKLQLNGSASIVVQGQSKEKLDNRDRGAITAKEDTGIEKFTDMRVSELSSIETPLPKPEIRSDSGITTTLSQKSDVESLEAACAEEDSGKYVELKEHVEETDVTPSKGTEIQKLDLSLSESSPLSLSEESPIRPARTKELNIPSTPVVTEATPPTSPPITMQQELESEAKASKKSMKKAAQKSMQESELPEDGDGTEKKPGKKAGKKVIKKVKSKSEESFEEAVDNSNAAGKAKKTAKVVKKTTKPAQMLGTDTSVPETPPPGSSDAPVPPKRKVKPTTGKTEEKSSKKSDAE
ncbi:hypothetical protein KM043_014243 [Ampulex compressa]|nr:hypothetical protein KM043_014243 [Ampulex compressa]